MFGIDDSRVEKTSANVTVLAECPTLSAFAGCATIKVEDYQTPSSSVDKDREASIQLDSPTPKVKKEIHEVDDLDHIVLKERLRMLLTGKLPGLSNTVLESSNGGLLETIMEETLKNGDDQINSANGKTAVVRDQCNNDFLEEINISPPLGATCVSSFLTDNASSESKGSVISAGLIEDGPILKSRGIVMQIDSHVEHNIINNDGPFSSTSPTFVKVKDEPWDYCENLNVNKDYLGRISIVLPNLKHEREVHNEYHDDQVDHMKLNDRLNFLKSGTDSSLHISTGYSSLKKIQPFSSLSSPIFSKSTKPSSINCRRKRKKTATDSVQEALEEDAPGLLQVLLDKGVLVDEIKLYGEEENDETLDESFGEDSFSELEAVMAKISSQRHTFLKFPLTRGSKTSRASYCFACLFSLVEQTRYLKFRKWPVEWGWCRDLQSFIFVFERHNRIVLERPEYGYATYFFELVESLPVQWQVKRLVIAMKFTTCSRISIIENKELVVGEDLSEGEAKALSREDLASRLSLTTDDASVGPLLLSDSFITIMDTNDYCAIPQQLKDQLGERYPEARRAYLKTGGDFPFLSRPDEVNLHLQLHLRRVGVEARPDLVHNIPKGDLGGSPSKESDEDDSDKSHEDDRGGSENSPADYDINPTPESSGSGNLDKQPLDNSEFCHLDHEHALYALPGGFKGRTNTPGTSVHFMCHIAIFHLLNYISSLYIIWNYSLEFSQVV